MLILMTLLKIIYIYIYLLSFFTYEALFNHFLILICNMNYICIPKLSRCEKFKNCLMIKGTHCMLNKKLQYELYMPTNNLFEVAIRCMKVKKRFSNGSKVNKRFSNASKIKERFSFFFFSTKYIFL